MNFNKSISTKDCLKDIHNEFGENSTSIRTVRRYYSQMKNRGLIAEGVRKSGRPILQNKSTISEAVEADPSLSTRQIAKKTGFSATTVRRQLKALGLTSKLSTWSPHVLRPAHLKKRVFIAKRLHQRQESRNFLRRLVTADETWISYSNQSRKRIWSRPGCQVQQPKLEAHCAKVMATIFWNYEGLVHLHLLEPGQTMGKLP